MLWFTRLQREVKLNVPACLLKHQHGRLNYSGAPRVKHWLPGPPVDPFRVNAHGSFISLLARIYDDFFFFFLKIASEKAGLYYIWTLDIYYIFTSSLYSFWMLVSTESVALWVVRSLHVAELASFLKSVCVCFLEHRFQTFIIPSKSFFLWLLQQKILDFVQQLFSKTRKQFAMFYVLFLQ